MSYIPSKKGSFMKKNNDKNRRIKFFDWFRKKRPNLPKSVPNRQKPSFPKLRLKRKIPLRRRKKIWSRIQMRRRSRAMLQSL